MPHDLPPWQTVYDYFKHWRDDGTWERLNRELRIEIRESVGKDGEPSAAVLDSQTVKTTEMGGERGYDAGKKINGRKRFTLVDTLGLLLTVMVVGADVQESQGARLVLDKVKTWFPRLQKIWADGAYAGTLINWVMTTCHGHPAAGVWVLQIIKRTDKAKGFVLLPRRWVVERTFGWLNRSRRLSKDYERRCDSSETFIYLAMIHVMTKRLTGQQTRFASS